MNDLIRGVLSCLLISIPETTFMVILLIRFSGKKELLDIYRFRENIKWYIILIVPPSVLMDTLNYGFKIQPRGLNVITCITLLYVLSIYVFKKTQYEEVKYLKSKIFIKLIPLYISLIFVDLLTTPIFLNYLGLTYLEISQNMNLVLLCSIPSRIIEFTAIIIILTKKNIKFQVNIINYISKNNFFRNFCIVTISSLLIFEIYVLRLILFNNILAVFISLVDQIIFVICFTYLVPSLILIGVYLLVSYSISLLNSGRQNS